MGGVNFTLLYCPEHWLLSGSLEGKCFLIYKQVSSPYFCVAVKKSVHSQDFLKNKKVLNLHFKQGE